MSDLGHDDRHEEMPSRREELPRRLITRTLLYTAMLFFALCALTYVVLRARVHVVRPSYRFPERDLPAPDDIAGVHQHLFRIANPRPTIQQRDRAMLDGFGWIDRTHGIVRIPVEVAIDIIARRSSSGGGTP